MKKKIQRSDKFPVYKYSYKSKNKLISREILERNDTSHILAVNNGKIIVVRQNRFPNGFSLEIPSGYLKKGEKPVNGAIREFKEETGYKAKRMIPLLKFYRDVGYNTQKVHCFIAKDFELVDKPNLDDDEILHTKIMSFKKFMALIKSGKIVDPPSIIAVLMYAIKNKLN